jgi:hypothetical protein
MPAIPSAASLVAKYTLMIDPVEARVAPGLRARSGRLS